MKATYQTQPRKKLIDYLQRNAERQFTIDELLLEMDETVARSSMYRLLNKLTQEGIVRRSVRAGERQSAYQIIACQDCHHHLHLQCTGCGKVMHLSDEATRKARKIMNGAEGFELDYEKSLLYGVCTKCQQRETL